MPRPETRRTSAERGAGGYRRLRIRAGGGGTARHRRDRGEAAGPASERPARLCRRHHSGRRTGGRDSGRGGTGGARRRSRAGAAEAAPGRQPRRCARRAKLHSLLLFHNAPGENCAVPIEQVSRIERVRPEQIEYLGGRRTMQYCGASLPLVTLHDVAAVGELSDDAAMGGDRFRERWAGRWDCWPPSRWTWWKPRWTSTR